MRAPIAVILVATVVAIPPQGAAQGQPSDAGNASSVEDIYIARSWRESRVEPTSYCDAARTGFAGSTMEDRYTFHSVATRTTDGLVTNADTGTIGELHACFGPLPDDAASFNFYAEGKLNGVTFTGRGNCLSTRENYPEPGLSGFRCYLDLTDLPPTYVGGQLATNTIVRAPTAPAGTVDPPGYVQQSIATVRLWKRSDASGATAYTKYCASCHDQVGARIPTRDALAEMSPARILRTLDFGLMMSIAYPMKRDEREAVAAFLGKGGRCGAAAERVVRAGHRNHGRCGASELGRLGTVARQRALSNGRARGTSAPPTSRGSSSNGRTVLPATSSRSRRPPS